MMMKLCLLTCVLAAWLALAHAKAPNCTFTSTQYTMDWASLKDGNRWFLRKVFSNQVEGHKAMWIDGPNDDITIHHNVVNNGECAALDSTFSTPGNSALVSRSNTYNGMTMTEKGLFVLVDANTMVYARELKLVSDVYSLHSQYLGVYTKSTTNSVSMDAVKSSVIQNCESLNDAETVDDYSDFQAVCTEAV